MAESKESTKIDIDIDSNPTSNLIEFIKGLLNCLKFDRIQNLKTCMQLSEYVKTILPTIPNVIQLYTEHVFCVGDIHGQIYDLCKAVLTWIKYTQTHPNTKFVFLGDAVDRGQYSVECLSLIFYMMKEFGAYKTVFYLRGNHEESKVNGPMGFGHELMNIVNMSNVSVITDIFDQSTISRLETEYEGGMDYKCSKVCWFKLNELFYDLPSMIFLNTETTKYALIHGCPPTDPYKMNLYRPHPTIDELNMLPRYSNVFTQIRWNDPTHDYISSASKRLHRCDPNPTIFDISQSDIQSWMEFYEIDLIVRGHELPSNGRGIQRFPSDTNPIIVTVFTGSNYIGQNKNSGACLFINGSDCIGLEHSYLDLENIVIKDIEDVEKTEKIDLELEEPLTPYPVDSENGDGGFPKLE